MRFRIKITFICESNCFRVCGFVISDYIIIKILKGFSRAEITFKNRKHGSYFEVPAVKDSSVTLTISDDENQRNVYCNVLHFIGQSIQSLISIKRGSKRLKSDDLEQRSKPIEISGFSEYTL